MPQTLDKSELVAVRDSTPDDKNFILATWLRGLYYGDSWFSVIPKKVFMECYHTVLENLLKRPETIVKVSCLKDDPEVVLGYAVYRDTHGVLILDYVFVKSAWRGIGIAKSLIPSNVFSVTHLTKSGYAILRKKMPNVPFNPFLI